MAQSQMWNSCNQTKIGGLFAWLRRGGSFHKVAMILLWIAALPIGNSLAQSPKLVTKVLPDAVLGHPYSAELLVGSVAALNVLGVNGLPTGLFATLGGNGEIKIRGTPTAAGSFVVVVSASNSFGVVSPSSATLKVQFSANGVTASSAGVRHTCVVASGGVQCWGSNSDWQLGTSLTSTVSTPVIAIPAGSGATAVAAGEYHTCAQVQGGVKCWGDGGLGKLGNNSTLESYLPVEAIAPNSGVTWIAAGSNHSCAVVDGGVKCWGYNANGELGNGNTSNSLIPVAALPPQSGAAAVSTGSYHSCALVSGGVLCWGSNSFGMLGNNSNVRSSVPVTAIPSGSGIEVISAGEDFTCAVKGGGLQCWGHNAYGKLGNGNTASSLIPLQVIPQGSGVSDVSAGANHTCVVQDGGVRCWGRNTFGQLGGNAFSDSLSPIQAIPAGSGVSAITSGANHSCARIGDLFKCWGDVSSLQTGRTAIPGILFTPSVPFPDVSDAVGIDAGISSTCTLERGGVRCWGANGSGQLGNNSRVDSDRPVQAIAEGSNATATAVGAYFACAVVGGGVKCWGENGFGQLGINNRNASLTPVSVNFLPEGSGVSAIASHGSFSCAIRNGGVVCWGFNNRGQIGNNNTTDALVPFQALPAGSGVTAIAVGAFHTCTVIAGGLQCWGDNSKGQLGNGTSIDSFVPIQVFPPGSNITAVSAGLQHTCAIIAGGLQCWGLNSEGQLGDGSSINKLAPVQIFPPGSGVTSVYAGSNHTCAVLNRGLYCWGRNDDGKLGVNSIALSMLPIEVIAEGGNVVAVAVGAAHTCAVINDKLACWGSNFSGQVGAAGKGPFWRPNPVTIAFSPQVTAVSLSTSGSPAGAGSPITFLASVTGAQPSGFATFRRNGAVISGCNAVPLVGSATQCTTSFPTVGSYSITADYSGDANNLASTGTLLGSQVIQEAVTTTVVSSSNSPVAAGSPVTIYASIAGSTPTGFVEFKVNGTGISGCLAQAVSSGVAACTTNFQAVGLKAISATYFGDANNLPSVGSLAGGQLVEQGTQVVEFSPTPQVVAGEPPITLVASSSRGLNAFSFATTSPSTVCTVTGNVLTIIGVGTCTVVATEAGDANFSSASKSADVTVNALFSLISVVSRSTHGVVGLRDKTIDHMSLAPEVSIEPRVAKSPRTIVIKFSGSVLSVGTINMVPTATYTVSTSGNELLISIPGPLDTTKVSFSITGVNGFSDTISFGVGFLVGDTTGTGITSAADIAAIKSRIGQSVSTSDNFLFDLNGDGVVDSKDLAIAKSNAARSIP